MNSGRDQIDFFVDDKNNKTKVLIMFFQKYVYFSLYKTPIYLIQIDVSY